MKVRNVIHIVFDKRDVAKASSYEGLEVGIPPDTGAIVLYIKQNGEPDLVEPARPSA